MQRWLDARFEGWPTEGAAAGRDRATGEPVLLKVATDRELQQALAREVSAAREVAHPALRHVISTDGARAAFEWIAGSEALAGGWPVARVAEGVLRALLALHSAGRVHGDVKPEHFRLDLRGVRLIDLGLAVRIGEMPAGGTPGFLAPEYLTGGVASVAGDLYALGCALAPHQRNDPRVSALVSRATSSDPMARPASCEAGLAMLGARPRAIDRGVRVSLAGREAVLGRVRTAITEGARRVALRARVGDGGTALAWQLETMLDGLGPVALVGGALRAAAAFSRDVPRPVVWIVDQRGARDEGALEVLALHARAHDGTLVELGGTEGDVVLDVPALDAADVTRIARSAGIAVGPREVAAIVARTEGKATRVGDVVDLLARDERLSAADALARLDAQEVGTTDARAALAAGAPRRAIALLLASAPDLERAGDPAARALLAEALAAAGELARASATIDALAADVPIPDALVLTHARVLERLGEIDALLALVERARPVEARARAELAAHVATALFTRGRLVDALAVARRAEADPSLPPEIASRLACVASDASLRLGEPDAALAHAMRARSLAERTAAQRGEAGADTDRAMAQALARIAGVHAHAGRWRAAREGYEAALAAAERDGDRTALSPYLTNLAAAEHALFEVDRAIAHYERAAALARELDRAPSEAAALTNWATLLELVGASDEALPLLERAEALATARGAAAAVAQATMIRAEVMRARGDLQEARRLAQRAHDAFEGLSARRQALECALLSAEIAVRGGEPAVGARFLESRAAEARDAGLGGRVDLLAAEVATRAGDHARAARVLETAVATAEAAGEREGVLRMLLALARAHDRLGTGAAPAYLARATELRASLALHVPAGLRERFLALHALPVLAGAAASAPTVTVDASLRRIASLLRRTLRERDENAVLEAAIDEAIALTRAERAFLLARGAGRPVVTVARNLDRETIKNSRFRFSRSVAERVLSTGEPLVTASAPEDPELAGAKSIHDLGLRSIVCVPIRSHTSQVLHALYLDHRFERGRFGPADLEVIETLADVIGLCLENARLFRAAEAREAELLAAQEELRSDAAAAALEVERLSRSLGAGEASARGIVGRSPALRAAIDLCRRVAPSALSVLIEGESGTGKELFARLVHEESPRRARALLSLNCGALPEALLESELFGHVRGAFTGATRDHPGLFRAADGGTLFLDEIGEMPLAMQARLLRVLENGEVRAVGATKGARVDVRIVAATNRDLEGEVRRGAFREDLYFRLAGVRVRLPPLRERREDLPALASAILERVGPGKQLAPAAMRALAVHPMPGNVRELEQALRRAAIVCDGDVIHAADLGLSGAPVRARSSEPTLAEVEAALARHGGNRSHAAQALGVHRTTLHRLIKKKGVESAARKGRPKKR